jgi:hypothetical protein
MAGIVTAFHLRAFCTQAHLTFSLLRHQTSLADVRRDRITTAPAAELAFAETRGSMLTDLKLSARAM